MARKARIHYPGAFFHVMLRGNAKQTIFHDSQDFNQFETYLCQGAERYRVRVCAFCWMPNHVHLAVQVSDVPLSKMMQVLSQRYTGWVNYRYDRVGHLFQGRYRAILVDKDCYLRELVRYIHLNPVRAGIVSDPLDYWQSSHRAYAAIPEKPISWLTTEPVLRQFGATREMAHAAYLHFMGQPEGEKLLDMLRHGGSHGHILGDDDFVARVRPQTSEPHPADEGRGEATTRSGPHLSLDHLTARVAEACQVQVAGMLGKSKSRPLVEARMILAMLAMDHYHCTLQSVARHLNRNEATISRQVTRLRERMTKFDSLRKKITAITP